MKENTLASKTAANNQKQAGEKEARAISLERHRTQCSICKHPACQDIEHHIINWIPLANLAASCDVSYDALYRHAQAFDLFQKRQGNIRRLLERGIDRLNLDRLDNSHVISLIKIYAKMNIAEQTAEKTQAANVKKAFERMSPSEREAFAQDGSVPEWLSEAKPALPDDRQEGDEGNLDHGSDVIQ